MTHCCFGNPGDMAYRKVSDTHGGPVVGEVLHCDGGLDLDWNLEKEELPELGPSMDHMQMQHVDSEMSGNIYLNNTS